MNTLHIAFYGSAPFVAGLVRTINGAKGQTLGDIALAQLRSMSQEQEKSVGIEEEALRSECVQRPVDLRLIVTQPDRQNRKKIVQNEIAKFAVEENIPLFQPHRVRDEYSNYSTFGTFDIAVVAAYGQILPVELIEMHRYGMVNWHPSLLPELRGPTPMQSSIAQGDKHTGLSWIEIAEKMDAGDIYVQLPYQLSSNETFTHLARSMITLGQRTWALALALRILDVEMKTTNFAPKRQKFSEATFCSLLSKGDQKVVPEEITAVDLDRRVRAYEVFPGTKFYSKYFEEEVVILSASLDGGNEVTDPERKGELVIMHSKTKHQAVYLECQSGYLRLNSIRRSNGKVVNFSGFQFD